MIIVCVCFVQLVHISKTIQIYSVRELYKNVFNDVRFYIAIKQFILLPQ